MKLEYFTEHQTRTSMTYDPFSDVTHDLSCHRLAAWAYMCAHADDGSVIRPFVPTLVPSLHDSRRVNRRRTAALQPRAADRAHPAHRTRDRPCNASDSIAERLPANRARAGASHCLPLRKTTHQVVSELGVGCGRADAPTWRIESIIPAKKYGILHCAFGLRIRAFH